MKGTTLALQWDDPAEPSPSRRLASNDAEMSKEKGKSQFSLSFAVGRLLPSSYPFPSLLLR